MDEPRVNHVCSSKGVCRNHNNHGDNPLLTASLREHLEVVRALLAAGADVNKSNSFGETPLYMASYYGHHGGHLEVVRALLAAGVDVSKSNNFGETPLYRALYNKQSEIADLLRDAGAHEPVAGVDSESDFDGDY